MVGARSGMAVKAQVRSLPTPCSVAAPSPLMTKRRSSLPLGSGDFASALSGLVESLGDLDAALALDVEMHVAGRAHHELAAGRHRHRRALRLRRLTRPQARQHHRRAPGIDRRRDPGIDAEIRRRHHAVPIEGGGDAFDVFAAGAEETRDHQNEHQRAQRHRIAQRQPRRRPAGLELARRHQRALDMSLPERLRHRVVIVGGDMIDDGGGRAMRFSAHAVEPAQAVMNAGQPQPDQRHRRGNDDQREDQKARWRGRAAAAPARDRPRRR